MRPEANNSDHCWSARTSLVRRTKDQLFATTRGSRSLCPKLVAHLLDLRGLRFKGGFKPQQRWLLGADYFGLFPAVWFMRLRKRGALLLFYQPNVCGTDIAVATHIRAEVRAVDMLAL